MFVRWTCDEQLTPSADPEDLVLILTEEVELTDEYPCSTLSANYSINCIDYGLYIFPVTREHRAEEDKKKAANFDLFIIPHQE